MYGYVIDTDMKWNLIGQRNPQDPQVSCVIIVIMFSKVDQL